MAIIELEIDDTTLFEADEVLGAIGLDVQTSVNIFLRRVAIEKGLPMQMTALTPRNIGESIFQEVEAKTDMSKTRSNNTITEEMVEEVWKAFLKYRKGLGEINHLRDDVAEATGMNSGSAFIYLNILANLIKGEPNTRNLKMKDLEYLMGKIKNELSQDEYNNAIHSLRGSTPYWRDKIPGSFADRVEKNLNSIWKV